MVLTDGGGGGGSPPPANVPNPCHADCLPFMCHGPTKLNCVSCSGNLMLRGNACVCKPGWFTITTTCDTYVANCAQIQIFNGAVSCAVCQSKRDTLAGGVCTRDITNPFFIRSTAGIFTASTQNTADIDYFYTNRCLSLNDAGTCLECYPDSSMTVDKTCVRRNTYCDAFDGNDNCVLAAPSTYVIKQNPLSIGFCYGTCKSCTGPGYYDCLSCHYGNYFVQTPNQMSGACYTCHSSCKSCTGPTALECTLGYPGTFVERKDATTAKQVLTCPTACAECNSAQDCTRCSLLHISNNGVCTSTANSILKCLYQYNSPSGNSCLKYNQNYLTGTDFKGYKTNIALTTVASICRYASPNYPDRISAVCQECNSISNQYLDAGFCRSITYTIDPNCDRFVGGTITELFCTRCMSGLTLATNKTCQPNCQPGETKIVIDSHYYCTACPIGCNSCVFSVDRLVCQDCLTSPVPFVFYKNFCLSTSCGDGIVSLNKECDPKVPGQPAGTCTADCLFLDPMECASGSCIRRVFQINDTAINTMTMTITPRYIDFVQFDLFTDIIYDSSNPSSQLFFCSLVFTEIKDDQATCSFDQANQLITIVATTPLMAAFTSKTVTMINTNSIIPIRRSLLLQKVDFSIDPNVPVSVQKPSVKQVVVITTPSLWSLNSDLPLTFVITEQLNAPSSVVWTITSCLVAGSESPSTRNTMNSALSTSFNFMDKSLLADGVVLTEQVTVTFPDGTSQVATKQTTLSSLSQPLALVGSPVVTFALGTSSSLLFMHTQTNLDPTLISVTVNGVALVSGSFQVTSYQDTQRVMVIITPQDLQSYEVAVDYSTAPGTSLPSILTFIQANQPIFANFIIPSTFGANQNISFWTSAGSDYNYTAFIFRKANNSKLLSVSSTPSIYENTFVSNLTTLEDLWFFIVLKQATGLSSIFKFEISLTAAASVREPNIPIRTSYRDGSSLHSSKVTILTGVYRENHIISLPYPASDHRVLKMESGTVGQTVINEQFVNHNNSLESTPSLGSLTTFGTITDDYSYTYVNEAGSFMTSISKLSFFNNVSATTTVTQVSLSDSSKATFEVSTSTTPAFNTYNVHDPTQFTHSLKLFYSPPLNASQHILPVVLPGFSRYSLLSLPPLVFPANISLHPTARVSYFDHNTFTDTNSLNLGLDSSWSGTQAPLATYVSDEATRRSGLNGADLLKVLNLQAFVINQAYVECVLASDCSAVGDYSPLNTSRTDLVASFKSFWDTVTDKEGFQDWDTSVLKNSFINSISLDPSGLVNTEIDTLESELNRQIPLLFTQVNSTVAGMSRTSYQIVESLKPLKTVNQQNVDLMISAVSHQMGLYTKSYTLFSNATQLQTSLDRQYSRLVGLNELRLLRYCHVSDTTVFQNEVVLLGGTTLTSPLRNNYVFNFGSGTAVELKNLQFDKSLPTYDLSVVTFSDSYYSDLNATLAKYNASAESLNKSRTLVGFSNSFSPVNPKNDSTTEINIYRPLTDCRGTPCDVNKKLNYGQEIILCECLKPTDVNKFADNFKVLTQQTGEVIAETGCQLGATVVAVFVMDPSTSAKNYKIWLNSVVVIFVCLTCFVGVALALESKVIDPGASRIFTKFSTMVAISELLKDCSSTISDSSCTAGDSSPNSEGGSTSSSDCSIREQEKYSSLTPLQIKKMKDLKKQLENDEKSSEAFKSSEMKQMTNLKLFGIVYLTHHYVLAIFTSNACNYARKSMIMMVYTRMIYGLALTMFMAMGMNKDGFSSYQSFILKCLVAPMFISGAFIILKKLVRNEKAYGVSLVNWCPKKNSLPSASKVAPQQLTRAHSKSMTDRTLNQIDESPKTSVKESVDTQRPGSSSSAESGLFSKATSVAGGATSAVTKKAGGLAMVIVGYAISTAMVPFCGMIIYSVTVATQANNTWPFGYWFVAQIAYDMTLGQVLPSLLQLGMFKAFQANKAGLGGVLGFIGKFNPLLNTDVAELNKMAESMKASSSASSGPSPLI